MTTTEKLNKLFNKELSDTKAKKIAKLLSGSTKSEMREILKQVEDSFDDFYTMTLKTQYGE